MEDTTPLVDGLRLTDRVDDAGSGEVWRARVTGGLGGARGDPVPGELPGVGECVLRLLRLPVEESMRSRALALAGDLLALDDPGVVAIASVRRAYDGVALIFAALPEPVLGLHLLARQRQLAAGEIVTLGVAVAWALDAGHRLGITHGRLRDADVLLDSAGRPRLCGMGVLGVLGSPGTPEQDTAALARLLASLLDATSTGAGRVLEVLADRSLRAAELAGRLASATPAAPIDVSDPNDPLWESPSSPAERSRSVRRDRRVVRVAAVVAAAIGILLLAGVIGWVSAPGATGGTAPQVAQAHAQGPVTPTDRAQRPAHASAVPVPDWKQILAGLDTARSEAFAGPVGASMGAIDAPGSVALRYDQAALQSLTERGAHAVGLRMTLDRVSLTSASTRSVTLLVSDRRPAYEVRDAANQLISRVAARGAARHLIELQNVASVPQAPRWRIASVTDPPGPS